MAELVLVKPSADYLKEIEDYRAEFITDDPNINGSSQLQLYEDVNGWIEQCRLGECRDTLPKCERQAPLDDFRQIILPVSFILELYPGALTCNCLQSY